MRHLTHCLTLTFTIALMAPAAESEETVSAADRGRDIAEEQDRRDTGWGDSAAELEMILRRANGQETVRRLRIKLLEVEGDGDKGLTIFDEPRDVQGTTFLSYSHALKPDDQWIYLPKLRRTKRISSKNKTGRFMASEFTFEDMSSVQLEKYDYQYLGEDTLGDQAVFILESVPKDEFSGYSKLVSYIDQKEYRTLKVEFHDVRGKLLKTMVMSGYTQYLDKYWRANELEMTNHQTGKSTVLAWKNYTFGEGLKASDFHQSVLERSR